MNAADRSPLRALMVTPGLTFLPSDIAVPTPDGALTAGLGALLTRIQARFTGDGVLLIDGRTAVTLGLPVTLPKDGIEDHPALVDARAAGWTVSKLRAWTTFHAEGRATVHLGILSAIDPERSPVICPSPFDTLTAVTRWHELVGTAWRGTAGVAGMAALKALADGGQKGCTWQPDAGPDRADAYELDYKVEQWKGRLPKGHRFGHGYDAYRMYLSAAGVTPLCPWRLRPTGKTRYAKDKAGWWLVSLSPWQAAIPLPDPAGYSMDEPGQPRWLTGPTLVLLDQLTEEGIYGGYEVLDSWPGPDTADSNGRPLKPWADRFRDVGGALPEPIKRKNGALPGYDAAGVAHPDAVAFAVKSGYRETLGLLNSPTSLVRRADWHYGVIAQARVNLWRKMRKIGQEEKRWPLKVDVDNVWYSAVTDDRMAECPQGLALIGRNGVTRGLGKFTAKDTHPLGKVAA